MPCAGRKQDSGGHFFVNQLNHVFIGSVLIGGGSERVRISKVRSKGPEAV